MLLFLDIETTGFEKEKDSILEVSAVRFDGQKEVARFDRLVLVDHEIPENIVSLTGITNDLCESEGIELSQLQQELEDFLKPDDIIIGHNISFDTGFLKAKGVDISQDEIDTFFLSLLVLGRKEESHSLEVLSTKYGLMHESAHRALSDVLANAELYWLLERVWKENFDPVLDAFLQEYSSKLSFPEKYFFDSVRQQIQSSTENSGSCKSYQSKTLPSFSAPVHVWADDSSRPQYFTELFTSFSSPVLWETSFPERYLKSFLYECEEKQKKAFFLYPSDKKTKYLELYEELKKYTPSLQFFLPSQFQISDTLWQKFLEKESYSRAESLVLIKIWTAKHRDEEVFLKFLNDEWPVFRGLIEENTSHYFQDTSLAFAPFESWENIENDTQIILLEGDKIEDMITENNTIKCFTKRWKEDCKDTPEWNDFSKSLTEISTFLREWKKENSYTLSIPFVQAQEKNGFLEIWNKASEKAIGEWTQFFDPEKREDKNIFLLIELFPDNELAFSLIPIDVSHFINPFLAKTPLIIGKSFPRVHGETFFSFDFPLSTQEYIDPLPSIQEFILPKKRTQLSSVDFASAIQEHIPNGENIVISVNSKKVLDEIIPFVRTSAQEHGYQIFSQGAGSIGKVRTQMFLAIQKQKVILLGTPKYLDSLRLEDFPFTTLMVSKPMFDPPKQPFLSQRRALYKSDFEEFSLPRALMRFRREVRRLPFIKTLFLGDGRVGDPKNWARVFWTELMEEE